MKNIRKIFINLIIALLISTVFTGICSYADFSKSAATTIYGETDINALKAKSYALLDFNSGIIVAENDGKEHYNVGYLSQLMTLYLAYEAIENGQVKADEYFRIQKESQDASVGRSRVFLDASKKEVITIQEAIDAVAICNAVDAAHALALYLGGTIEDFVKKMNEKAGEMGLEDTYFTDATGSEREVQYTSADDLVIFGKILIEKYPQILELTSKTYGEFQHTSTNQEFTAMVSGNNLIRGKFYTDSDGMGVGYSKDVGYSMLATVKKDGKRIIACVIGEEDENYRAAEARKLLEYGLTGFEYKNVSQAGTFVRKVKVKDGVSKRVSLYTAEDFNAVLKTGDFGKLTTEVVLYGDLTAPVAADTEVGEIIYKVGDKEVGKVKVVVTSEVKKANWFTRLVRKILSWLGLD